MHEETVDVVIRGRGGSGEETGTREGIQLSTVGANKRIPVCSEPSVLPVVALMTMVVGETIPNTQPAT
ncbi:hypothetical protein L596_004876 [Steinernema carpocapsae]|uniref:Uncharacterized protein n=1 Tax=Steinernema carpocapsae TaxID=34508 RepID=A0A4U8UYS1_STECR|nr:hypothetical protein L596_004876 [Steinernema carpocapsae]